MSRTDQRRRRVLRAFAPVAGLLAVGLLVWQGSYAAFSATTNNTNNAWATGSLTLTNDAGTNTFAATTPFSTAGLFGETLLKPLDTKSKCLTVKSGGTAGGNLMMYRNGAAGGSAALAAQLGLTITAISVPAPLPATFVKADCSNFPAGGAVLATNTALSALPSAYVGGVGPFVVTSGVQYIAYKITYIFNSTGSNPGDNALQTTNTTADFTWELQ